MTKRAAVLIIDADARIREYNERAAECFGLTAQAIGSDVQRLLATHTDIEVSPTARSGSVAEVVSGFDQTMVTIRDKTDDGDGVFDGSEAWVEVTHLEGELSDDTRTGTRYVLTLRDISVQRRERRIHDIQQDQIEQFNVFILHKLLDELNLILEIVHRLKSTSAERDATTIELTETQLEYLSLIYEQGLDVVEVIRKAEELIDVIIHSADDLEPTKLPELLYETVGKASASTNGQIWVAEEIPDVTVPASDGLPIALQNLLTNAVQHTECETPSVAVSASVADDEVTVRVRDDGPGIPAERRDRIFDPGVTLSDTGSLGIGLFIVESTVEQHGGTVWVEDNADGGSTFCFTLPVDTGTT